MIAVITLTEGAYQQAERLKHYMPIKHVHKPSSFKIQVETLFQSYDTLLFIMATGIVVRTLADQIKSKLSDPAILVMDESAKYVISLLSGHLGGANEKAIEIAGYLNAQPVITTASDVKGVLSIDMFAKKYQLILKDMEGAKKVTSLLVNDQDVQLIGLKDIHEKQYVLKPGKGIVYVGHKKPFYEQPSVQLIPKNLILSMGCKRNTPVDHLYELVQQACDKNDVEIEAIRVLTSAWVKADEAGLIELAKRLDIPFITCDKCDILAVEDQFVGSEFVKKTIGVSSVALPCGYLVSNKGDLKIDLIKSKGMTITLWEERGN